MELTIEETITKILRAEFVKACNDLEITNYEIYDEQEFADKDINPNLIYIIFTAKQGTNFFKSRVVPIDIKIISEQNTLKKAKNLADIFGSEFTLEPPIITIENAYIQQAYSTPQVDSNFEEIDNGYRSIISFEGTFVVAFDVLSFQSVIIDNEEISIIGLTFSYTNTPNPQPFYDSNARTKSEIKFGTLTFGFNVESQDCAFLRKVFGIALGSSNINNDFVFNTSLGTQAVEDPHFKLITCDFKQQKGEIPQVSLTFAR